MAGSSYLGLLELILVFGFVLGWGVLELVGLGLDRARERDRSKEGPGHPER
jgi:hypothetical protein